MGTQKCGPIKQFMESSVVPYISFTEPLTKIWVSHLPCSNHKWLSQMCTLQLWSKWTRGCQHKNIQLGGREVAFFNRKKIGGIKIKSFKSTKYFAFLLFILRMDTLLSSYEGFKINQLTKPDTQLVFYLLQNTRTENEKASIWLTFQLLVHHDKLLVYLLTINYFSWGKIL